MAVGVRFRFWCIGLGALLSLGMVQAVKAEPASPARCDAAVFRVLLDVGHTEELPGTYSARGVPEYAFNLRLAKRIRQELQNGGFVRTELLITHGDRRNRQLFDRAARASALKPDLLLSVHHDDTQDRYHATWTYDGKELLYSDRFAGYSLFVSRLNRHYDASLSFAKKLGAALRARNLDFTRHHAENIPGERRAVLDDASGVFRFDGLVVLKATAAPAVLFEAGVILNRDEELVLASPERQELIATAVLAAVQDFCAERQGRR